MLNVEAMCQRKLLENTQIYQIVNVIWIIRISI